MPELTPRAFSFNSPHGACPECQGLGATYDFEPRLIVPDDSKSLLGGAIAPWATRRSQAGQGCDRGAVADLRHRSGAAVRRSCRRSTATCCSTVPAGAAKAAQGRESRGAPTASRKTRSDEEGYEEEFELPRGARQPSRQRSDDDPFGQGLRGGHSEPAAALRGRLVGRAGGSRAVPHAARVSRLPRPAAQAARAWPCASRAAAIAEYVNLPISEALDVFEAFELTERETLIAARVLREIRERLRFLHDVGVGYLTLNRSAATLSGGEGQRIRLATQIGANLTGVLYVLDEPSIGLHQRDNRKLLSTLSHLRDLGNTVVVVEHDEETIRTADYVVDLGPGAGEHGGQMIFQGRPDAAARARATAR